MWMRRECEFQQMKIEYTSKKFYSQFIYKISLSINTTQQSSRYFGLAPELAALPSWLQKSYPKVEYKINNRFQTSDGSRTTYHQLLYISDGAVKDAVCKTFGAQLVGVTQPLNQSHADELEIRNVVCVRDTLLFKQFKYCVYFKYDRKARLYPWLLDYYANNESAKVSGDRWWPRVYLHDDTEIAAIKLTWPDAINYVKRVLLINNND